MPSSATGPVPSAAEPAQNDLWDDDFLPLPISNKRPRLAAPAAAPLQEAAQVHEPKSQRHQGVDIPLAGEAHQLSVCCLSV